MPELAHVAGHEDEICRQRVGGDQHVVGADRAAAFLQRGAKRAIGTGGREVEVETSKISQEDIEARLSSCAMSVRRSAISEPMGPVAGAPLVVCHGQDADAVLLNRVEQAVRKAEKNLAAHVSK